jgi:nucleolar protein 12
MHEPLAGNQSKVKQICVRKGLFGSQKGSFNAYIVFKSRESVEAAMTLNNTVIGARHIRCDRVPPTLFDPKLSVFVGSVHLYADEEQLRTHFGAALANGADDIQSVRIVRDPETLVGKGIAYVLFKSAESVVQALSLHGKAFKKRELRVSTCGKRTKRTEARRTGVDPSEKKAQQEKRFAESDAGISRQNAMKRLEKKVCTVCVSVIGLCSSASRHAGVGPESEVK